MKQISILGCGWLGLPLAKSLVKADFLVKGSTTSKDKMFDLKNSGIKPFLITLLEDSIIGNVADFLFQSDYLVINIPPKLRGSSNENFVSKITNLIPFIENSTVKKVLFVSSTSVYSDSVSVVDETTTPNPDSEGGKQLLEIENILKLNSYFETTIVRFGGLIGNDRNPVIYLSGKKNIENPDSCINFIHQKDCIFIIKKIIENSIWNETFNAVAPFHPSRKAYYTRKAKEFGLELPEFNASNTSVGKIIASDKVSQLLNIEWYDFNEG